eukprot:4041044-Prymnesium_polylepis.1
MPDVTHHDVELLRLGFAGGVAPSNSIQPHDTLLQAPCAGRHCAMKHVSVGDVQHLERKQLLNGAAQPAPARSGVLAVAATQRLNIIGREGREQHHPRVVDHPRLHPAAGASVSL